MQRKLGAIALLLFLSLSADAKPGMSTAPQDTPLCGVCLELDNETLPDKHYFPDKFRIFGTEALVEHADRSEISAQVWTTEAPHATPQAAENSVSAGSMPGKRTGKHGQPSTDAADLEGAEWAWGGLRECSRGPEGKITAGCHTAHYDNLLCNSHYDDCDNEHFALAVNAVRDGDTRALRDLLQHSGNSAVVLNRKRAAIQLIGCTGETVGHLPIDRSLLRALQQ